MSKTISVRLPDELAERLGGVADETERPKAFHIQKALEAYLEEFADLQIALHRVRDQTDPVFSGKELRKALGILCRL